MHACCAYGTLARSPRLWDHVSGTSHVCRWVYVPRTPSRNWLGGARDALDTGHFLELGNAIHPNPRRRFSRDARTDCNEAKRHRLDLLAFLFSQLEVG